MKNYYKILGVLDDAEDIIIRAAFKALAQRYHPDKWTGDKNSATQKMAEINEAYDILSDSAKRKNYDNQYFEFNSRNDRENFEDEFSDQFNNEKIEGWEIACEFYPNIIDEYLELKKISILLANTFRNFLIESKQFNNSKNIKLKLEDDYLSKFYSDDQYIKKYAKYLLLNSHTKAAIKLNKIIRALGQSANFNLIQAKINTEFPEIVNSSKSAKIIYSPHFNKFSKDPLLATIDDAIKIIEIWYETTVNVDQRRFSNCYSFTDKKSSTEFIKIDNDALKSIAYKIVQDLNVFYPK
jgi:curved DNA-binding protein CbpA